MAEHLPYYGHEQGCYNSKIPWGPEPCSGCVSLRRAFSQGQRDALAAAVQRVEAYVAEIMSVPGLDADVYDFIAAIKGGNDGCRACDAPVNAEYADHTHEVL